MYVVKNAEAHNTVMHSVKISCGYYNYKICYCRTFKRFSFMVVHHYSHYYYPGIRQLIKHTACGVDK